MDAVRPIDRDALARHPLDERYVQRLLDRTSGADQTSVNLIRTPAGGGSPEGLHVHDFEQVFYLLEGTMSIEVAGVRTRAEAGSLIVFPPGVPHRNWNEGDVPTVHLAFAAPAPPVGQTGTYPVAGA